MTVRRKLVLAGGCVLAAAVAAFGLEPDKPGGVHVAPAPKAAQAVHAAPASAAERDPIVAAAGDPFRLPPPEPPPMPAATAVEPPPAPSAPPFPYRYFGRMTGPDGKVLTYLVRGEKPLPIREKDVLDTEYRVDSVSETEILVTYLPMNEQTRIATAPAN